MNLLDILGINKKPVDAPEPVEGKAYVKTIQEKSTVGGMGAVLDSLGNKELSVVVDPYTGKYYGEGSQQEYINGTKSQITKSQQDLAYLTKTGRLPQSSSNPKNGLLAFTGGLGLDPKVKAAEVERLNLSIANGNKELANFQNNFTQQKDMLKSFNKYGDNWNKYFEGSYKNPRQSEANASQIASSGEQIQEANMKNKLKIPKTVGTGITSTGNLNPFGSLDAGLNI